MSDQNIMFGLSLPYGKNRKSKNVKQYVLMNVENNYFDRPLLLREYYLCSQNTESSLEQ